MNDNLRIKALYDCRTPYLIKYFSLFEYPWEILPQIKNIISDISAELGEDYKEISKGIFVGKNVMISDKATIEGPAIIGEGTVIRPGAYIRASVITGRKCVLGNSSEFKNCILLDRVQAPHFNYVGDSILGNHTHLGAGAICSNLKSSGDSVVIHASTDIDTGQRKLGAILGDFADIGSNCVLNPGTVVGKRTTVYPLTSLRGVVGENIIVKSRDVMVIKEA